MLQMQTLERLAEQLEGARQELLTIDPGPSERRKLDDAYNAIQRAQKAIADLLKTNEQ